jgi:hypothetical protein
MKSGQVRVSVIVPTGQVERILILANLLRTATRWQRPPAYDQDYLPAGSSFGELAALADSLAGPGAKDASSLGDAVPD